MLQYPTPKLILASGSASRRALMASAGLTFDVCPADVDEASVKRGAHGRGENPADAALLLADMKAAAVADTEPDALVIGADQILVCDGEWFDKPSDAAAARAQLLALRGRTHVLATATVCRSGERQVWHHVALPSLTMREFSQSFLDGYLAAEASILTWTVGSYRLEGRGVHLFDDIQGDHSAILGLPLLPLLSFLRHWGVLVA